MNELMEVITLPSLDPETNARFVELCAQVSEGELVARILPKLQWTRSKLFRIVESSDEARTIYHRARVHQSHALAEETISIADGTDELGKFYDDLAELNAEEMDPKHRGAWLAAFENGRVQRDRSRVAARTWYASKLAPRIYGEKLDVTTNGDSLRPGVVFLPPQDAALVPPADGMVIEQTTRVAVSGQGHETSSRMADLLYKIRQGQPLPENGNGRNGKHLEVQPDDDGEDGG